MGKSTPSLFLSIFAVKVKLLTFLLTKAPRSFDGKSLQRYGHPWNRGIRMGRAKGNLIENLATLPWPAGVVFGVGGFFGIRTPLLRRMHSAPRFRRFCKFYRGLKCTRRLFFYASLWMLSGLL